MRIVFLGTGTSHGIPAIGCRCEVCTSDDPRNRRRRSSLWVRAGRASLLIDASPDFRQQALDAGVDRVDALFLTHGHADHVFGMDDLRRFNEIQREAIPVYAGAGTMAVVRRTFAYALEGGESASSRPRLDPRPLAGPVEVGGVRVTPVEVFHGAPLVHGFRIDGDGRSLGYVPDCSALPEPAVAAFRGVDVMILDALRPSPHPTHLSLPQSLALLARIGAGRSYVTHLCHRLEHEATQRSLPAGCHVPHDGLEFAW